MSTSAQIVTRALKRINIVASDETPSAADAADGLQAMNAMIAGWEADGVNVSPDVPLDDKFEEGIVALLAVRLAPDYGKSVSAGLALDADKGWKRLQAAYVVAPNASFDIAAIKTPMRRFVDFGTVTPWAASTAYVVGDQVTNAGNVYEATVAGTSSASGGPTGTSSAITDGTVTWKYVRTV